MLNGKVVALLAGACLLTPATAGAQSVVFGSSLQAPPNLAIGCETQRAWVW